MEVFTIHTFIQQYTDEYIEVLQRLNRNKLADLHRYMKEANRIFILGNGGSSASASHWVCDFNKGVNYGNSERMQVYSLTDNTPLFSAIGNDMAYEDIFVEQLKNYLKPDDLVIGLSVSGNSNNIVKGLEYSNQQGNSTFSIIGDFDGAMKDYSSGVLIVPSKNYGIVEDVHMYIGHVLSQYMFEENKK